jgi:hypothetical protein
MLPVHALGRLATTLLGLSVASALAAQDPASPAARLKVSFRGFDINADGWLSGRELDACACRQRDRNGDGEVTWEEFRQGAQAGVGGGQRDGAAARDDDAPGAPAGRPGAAAAHSAQAAPAAAPRDGGAFRLSERVAVFYEGRWQLGNVTAVRDGRYQVSRDGWNVLQDLWFTPEQMRRVAPERPAARAPTLLGEWRYRALVSADGGEVDLGHGAGTLELRPDGTFEQSLATATTSNTLIGRYEARGGRLTLYPEKPRPPRVHRRDRRGRHHARAPLRRRHRVPPVALGTRRGRARPAACRRRGRSGRRSVAGPRISARRLGSPPAARPGPPRMLTPARMLTPGTPQPRVRCRLTAAGSRAPRRWRSCRPWAPRRRCPRPRAPRPRARPAIRGGRPTAAPCAAGRGSSKASRRSR